MLPVGTFKCVAFSNFFQKLSLQPSTVRSAKEESRLRSQQPPSNIQRVQAIRSRPQSTASYNSLGNIFRIISTSFSFFFQLHPEWKISSGEIQLCPLWLQIIAGIRCTTKKTTHEWWVGIFWAWKRRQGCY